MYIQRQRNSIRPELVGLLGDIAAQKVPVSGDVGLLIEVPCSIASGHINVTAMVEFGHGIFDSELYIYIIIYYTSP